jgi:hypothetical protein
LQLEPGKNQLLESRLAERKDKKDRRMSRQTAKFFWVLLFLFASQVGLLAQNVDSISHVPYRVGEMLNFSVNWTIGNIGTAELKVAAVDTLNGNSCYRIEAGARSNKTIDLFYPVRDFFISLIDRKKLFSRKFIKKQKEGKSERDRVFIYDQEDGRRYDLVSGDTADIVPEAQDELSIFYYFRTMDITIGRGLLLENFPDRNGNPLRVGVLRQEWVEVPAGRFYCWVVEPYITSGGLFEHKGNLLIWITSDRNRIPVKMISELDFGNIVVLLESYTLGKG